MAEAAPTAAAPTSSVVGVVPTADAGSAMVEGGGAAGAVGLEGP